MSQIINNIKSHWMIIIIIIIGSYLRFYKLNELAILFGDSGRDILAATSAVEEGSIPLLGIPSSVPRFRQGPLSIWLVMLLNIVFGDNFLIYSLVFAFIGTLAVIALYEYMLNFHGKKAAVLASLMLAFSPLAVAHSRMIYHITPTPLLVVLFLWSLQKAWKGSRKSFFLAGLMASLVFQTELSLFPLVLIPLIIMFIKKIIKKQIVVSFISGVAVGLTPQIIHDLTHRFAHLGGFSLWLGYRVIAAFAPTEHQFNQGKIVETLVSYGRYFCRIWSTDNIFISILMFLIFICSVFWLWKKRSILRAKTRIELLAFIILTIGYVIHGTPSEAYFPAYFIFLPIIISIGIVLMRLRYQAILITSLVIVSFVNFAEINQFNFFVSNNNSFSYGPSVGEQKEIIEFISSTSNGPFKLKTNDDYGVFPSYFDGYRYLMKQKNLFENENGKVFYVEKRGNRPIFIWSFEEKIARKTFPSIDVYYFQ
ncbi:MAG: glycosyltransferase family 39 protein [Patescibacteria group bacterium]